jgi:hypothetical protein
MSNSNGYNPNSLFALEYSLLGNNPAYRGEQFSAEEMEEFEEDRSRGVEAQAFDWDDAIALEYEEDTNSDSESISQQDAEELEEEDSARSMSWQNYGYNSRGFDLEDEDTPTYDVQAFAVEEEETTEGEDDPLSHSNSLFALEQSVFGTASTNEPAQQFSLEEPQHQPIESQAFDWDDAIALEYSDTLYPTSMSLDWQPSDYPSQSFSLEDEPSTYNVEAFEEEEESEAAPANEDYPHSAAYRFDAGDEVPAPPEEPPDSSQADAVDAFEEEEESKAAPANEDYPHSAAYRFDAGDEVPAPPEEPPDSSQADAVDAFEEEEESEAAPANEDYPHSAAYRFDAGHEVPAPPEEPPDSSQADAVDADYTPEPTSHKDRDSATIPVNATVVMPSSPPRKSAQPVEALSNNDFDEFERGTPTNRAADAEAFAADLAAILRGEKVYEPPAETPAPPAPAPAPAPQPQPAPQSQAESVPPKKSSPHDIFDQIGKNMAHATAFDLGTFSLEQKFDEFDRLLDEKKNESSGYAKEDEEIQARNTEDTANSFGFDEDELSADVAALSADEPWQAVQFQLEEDHIASLIESVPPNQNELKSKYLSRLKGEAKTRYRKQYSPKLDDPKISAAVDKLWSKKVSVPKVIAEDIKKRYWHHISIGGTESNPKEVSGYHWSGYEDNQAMFKRIGKPTKQDVFGIYKQSVQQKGTMNIKKDASSFFPDTWTEKHFDDLFNHFAQRRDFKPDKSGTYEILAAIGGDEKYKSMRVTFMPNAQGGSCIPVYVHEKDRDVQTQLALKIDPEPEVAQMQSQAQMLGQELSSSPYREMYAELDVDETDSPYGDVYTALGTDGVETDINSLNQPEIATAMGVLFTVDPNNQQAIIEAMESNKLSASLINPELERENQPTLTDPIQSRRASDPNSWNIEDETKQTYNIRLTNNRLEIHNKSPEQEDAINYLSAVLRDFVVLRSKVANNRDFPQKLFNKVQTMTLSLKEILERKNPAPIDELVDISKKAAQLRQDVEQYRPRLNDEQQQQHFLDAFKKKLQLAVDKEKWERGKKFGGKVEIDVPKSYWQAIYNQYNGQKIETQKTKWRGKSGEVVKYYVTQNSNSIVGFDISGHIWNGQADTSETVFVLHINWDNER